MNHLLDYSCIITIQGTGFMQVILPFLRNTLTQTRGAEDTDEDVHRVQAFDNFRLLIPALLSLTPPGET